MPPAEQPRIRARSDRAPTRWRPIEDWVEHDDPCRGCGARLVYAVAFDSYACLGCNEWVEAACDDPDCTYCRLRPPTPRLSS